MATFWTAKNRVRYVFSRIIDTVFSGYAGADAARVVMKMDNLAQIEEAARKLMDPLVEAMVSAGVGDNVTTRWNREAYDQIGLAPRFMQDLSTMNTEVELFGYKSPVPILLAPTGFQKLLHPSGELEVVKAAGAKGVIPVISNMTNTPLDVLLPASKTPLWFQIYYTGDRGRLADLVFQLKEGGCGALCLTIDTPSFGPRSDWGRPRTGFASLYQKAKMAASQRVMNQPLPHFKSEANGVYSGMAVTWDDVDWLKSISDLPLLLKGVLHPADAHSAMQHGVDGLVVSNHGGRNLDTSIATLDALGPIVEAIDGRCPVLVDGGIRRGADILKALALGARAVLIGRPYIYGLFLNGADGVEHVLSILERELKMAMLLTGQPHLGAIDTDILRYRGV